MTSETSNPKNVSPENGDDKAKFHTVGCRVQPSDLFVIDKAVMEIRHRRAQLNYSRSDFIHETILARALRVLDKKPTTEAA